MCMSGPFRDKVVAELEKVVGTNDSPRRPKASWELGVMLLSRFANPDASINQGLNLILQAAQEGDIRAKALYHQLYEAYGRSCPCSEDARLRRLGEAASEGNQIALSELRHLDPPSVVAAQAANARRYFRSTAETGVSPLHQAAASGRKDEVSAFLDSSESTINTRDAEGNTPLILACRFGQLETALLLLDRGANAAARNDFGENVLHYAWCFSTEEVPSVVTRLVSGGASLHDISSRIVPASELDLLPVLPGTPLERVAGRLRCDLVRLFVEKGDLLKISNGRLARRLLLWGLRLHDAELVDYLLEACIYNPSRYKKTLAPIIKTKWLHRGQERTMLEAACAGWISEASLGSHYPLRFWLACRHGSTWKQAVYASVEQLISFRGSGNEPWLTEEDVNKSMEWAVHESLYDAFLALLKCKVEMTPNLRSQLIDTSQLWWKIHEINASIM